MILFKDLEINLQITIMILNSIKKKTNIYNWNCKFTERYEKLRDKGQNAKVEATSVARESSESARRENLRE